MTTLFRIAIAPRWIVMFATFFVAAHAGGAVSPETIRDLALGEDRKSVV